MPNTKIRVAIVDDHEVVREGIRNMLTAVPDFEIVGEATDGDGARDLIARLKPHVMVLDLVMPGESPYAIMRWAAQAHPETAVLVLTGHAKQRALAQMLQAGAVGFLDKKQDKADLITAIRNAAAGQTTYTQEQYRSAKAWYEDVHEPWHSLSPTKQALLRALGAGLSNAEIAAQLHLSEKTVRKYVSEIFATLGVSSRTQAALWWQKSGLDEG
mgnify:CR=1 FL=1